MALARKISLLYGREAQLISSVGTAGQLKQGHLHDVRSFPNTTNLYGWHVDNAASGNLLNWVGGADLTLQGSATTAKADIFGVSRYNKLLRASANYWSNASIAPPTGDFSFGLWVNFDSCSAQASAYIAGHYGSAGNQMVWRLAYDSTGGVWAAKTLVAQLGDAAANPIADCRQVFSAHPSGWHFVAVVASGTTFQLYFDGLMVASSAVAGTRNVNDTDLFIGTGFNGTVGWSDALDEIVLHIGTAWSDHQVLKVASTRIDHNAGIAFARQDWKFKHYVAGAGPATDLKSGEILLDGYDTNSAFVDLSWADATDRVDYLLTDARGG